MMRSSRSALNLSVILGAVAASWLQTSWGYLFTTDRRGSMKSHSSLSPFGALRKNSEISMIRTSARTRKRTRRTSTTALFTTSQLSGENSTEEEELPPRQETTIRLTESGKEATLISRTVSVFPNASVTVWEWKNSSKVVNAYWEAQGRQVTATAGTHRKPLLDPFGLVSWPGSVLAARELYKHADTAVRNRNVVVFGAGVGVETQAVSMLGPKRVVATDIHPTTLQQLELGVSRNKQIPPDTIVETQILDLFQGKDTQPIPYPCDLLVVADVLYSETLATQVCRRCAEALEANPGVRILITDSQRFVPTFLRDLNDALRKVISTSATDATFPEATWKVETMKSFQGSGVIIDEDQTYDVTVQSLWIGL